MPSANSSDQAIFSYSYGLYLSKGVLAIAFILLFVSINICLETFQKNNTIFFLFLGLTLLGAFCFVPAEILQIDGKNKRYRVAIKIFYKWFGQWKPLPHTKYLSIVSISKTIHLSSATSNDLHKVHACQLRLFHSAGKYLEIDEFTYKESAIEIAHPLASILDLEILDATVKPSYFIAKKV